MLSAVVWHLNTPISVDASKPRVNLWQLWKLSILLFLLHLAIYLVLCPSLVLQSARAMNGNHAAERIFHLDMNVDDGGGLENVHVHLHMAPTRDTVYLPCT